MIYSKLCLVCRYWEGLLNLMWPRFQYILDHNIQSIRDCDPQKLGHIDVRPHYVSKLLKCYGFHSLLVKAQSSFRTRIDFPVLSGLWKFREVRGSTCQKWYLKNLH